MESFGALKNNAFGDFNKEDVLGYIDEMTSKTKKAELVLRDRVVALGKSREHLMMKIASFEKIIVGLEKHLADEREHVRLALMERDELSKKINVERDNFDSLLDKKLREMAESEREILQFAEQKRNMDQQMKELESKSRRYDDIRASVSAIRLDGETEAQKTTEQQQDMEAVLVIEDVPQEPESMKQQMNSAVNGFPESVIPSPVYDMTASTTDAAYPPIPDLTISETPTPEESNFSTGLPVAEHASQPMGDDLMNRLDALYRALDQSMEKLQNMKTQFIPKDKD